MSASSDSERRIDGDGAQPMAGVAERIAGEPGRRGGGGSGGPAPAGAAPHWTAAAGSETIVAGMEDTGSDTKPLRIDAERNLRRLLDAAARTFAEQGLHASIDEIAKRAEVGKGTVFRRFPTKEHLIAAILVQRLEDTRRSAEALLDAPDAGAALREFMVQGARMQAEDRGFFEAVAQSEIVDEHVYESKQKLIGATSALLARAQREGAVRDDVTAEDVFMMTCAAVQAAAPFHGSAPELWRRYLDLACDGLRSEAAHPLSHPAPDIAAAHAPAATSRARAAG